MPPNSCHSVPDWYSAAQKCSGPIPARLCIQGEERQDRRQRISGSSTRVWVCFPNNRSIKSLVNYQEVDFGERKKEKNRCEITVGRLAKRECARVPSMKIRSDAFACFDCCAPLVPDEETSPTATKHTLQERQRSLINTLSLLLNM